jgi:hypothetical protein
LITEFARAFPEYFSVFAGLAVAARDSSGSHVHQTIFPPVETPQ